jgi:hypothetical protein
LILDTVTESEPLDPVRSPLKAGNCEGVRFGSELRTPPDAVTKPLAGRRKSGPDSLPEKVRSFFA